MARSLWPRWLQKAAPGLPGYAAGMSGGGTGLGLGPGATTQNISHLVAALQAGTYQFERDPQTGQQVQFGPGRAPTTSPIGGDPRAWVYRAGYNLPTSPGEGKLVDWDTLKTIPRVYEIMGKAIVLRIDEMCSLHFDIIARDRDSQKARQVLKSQANAISEIKEFFAYPDKRLPWQQWLRAFLYQHLVLDAPTAYIRRNMDPDAGPVDESTGTHLGKMVSLELVDGCTIKPLVDPGGRRPLPPAPAYQQYVYGVPRDSYTSQELIYAPKNSTVDTPYGFSPVEQAVMHVNVVLKFWQSMLAIYTDGTLPEGVAEAPPDWTIDQIQEFNAIWDQMLAGDPRAFRKMRFVPSGFKFHDFKALEFNESFARYLLDVTCVCLDVTPIELGMEPSHGGLGGKGLGETLTDVSLRRSIRPTLRWLFDSVLNPVLWNEFGATDLEWTAIELDAQQETEKAKAMDQNLRNGRLALDELIEEDGGAPIGVGRLFVVGQTLYGEPDLIAISQQGALAAGYVPNQAAAGAGQPPPDVPGSKQSGDMAASATEVQGPAHPGDPAASTGDLQANLPPGPPNGANGASGASTGPPLGGRSSQAGGGLVEHPSATHTSGPAVKLADLRRYETKVLKATKLGKQPGAVGFASEDLGAGAIDLIRKALTECGTAKEVREVFEDARQAVSLVSFADAVDGELAGRV